MVILYVDIFRPQSTFELFRKLVELLNKRLADTTNNLNSNPESDFYNILKFYIYNFILKPDQVTFITFNYDIQIEKLIDEMGKDETIKTNLLNFPYCYQLPKYSIDKNENIERIDGKWDYPKEIFESGSKEKQGVKILKLHGSLNWHIFYRSLIRTKKTLFDKNRKMSIYSNKTLYTRTEKFPLRGKVYHSNPMIVPPVIHKSEIFHENIDHIWNQAEENLKEASEIIIFGYSFPESDFESFYLFKRALKDRNDIKVSIIDTDPSVIQKFVNITDFNKINWYKSPSDFRKHIEALSGQV